MLGERKVKLDGRERDLRVHEAALAEAQSRGLNPRDNHKELMEVIELRRLLQDAKVEHVTKAGQLVILAWDISEVLVDLGMLPILGIPWDPRMASDVLDAVGINLEHLWEAYASDHGPWD
jgi:hypothetical protein